MPEHPLVDITLGLQSLSLAALHALSYHERPEELHLVDTRAYYNGRERGFILQLFERKTRYSLYIVVVVDRWGDSNPIVRHWRDKSRSYDAPPCGETTPQLAYDREESFPSARIDLAVARVLELVSAFAASECKSVSDAETWSNRSDSLGK